ncbi:MAG: sulfotransferase [Pseudomonadota bacterium]
MKRPPPRPHPLARSPRVDQANRFFAKAWDKGWLPPPKLEALALWDRAAKAMGDEAAKAESAGRSSDDVADFRERLERLTTAAREEADLNPLGRVMAHGQIERVIAHRLRIGQVWLERPDMPSTSIAPPIIIIGHMRSGTTRVHKLLAADPAHSHTRYCDAFHPVPGRKVDLREWKATFEISFLSALNPWLQSIHPIASGEVEEELGWLAGAFQASIYESQWRIPRYSAWNEARDADAVYREFARVLRTDAAHRGNADRPRVLKVPAFSENLPELLRAFPDARLIVTERALEDVHRSAVSLVANQMAVQSDTCDLSAIEAEWRRKIGLREERRTQALKDWRGLIAHLTFEELNADWERAIARAYRDLDLNLTPKALSAMQSLMAKSDQGRHRAHSEQLAQFRRE